MNYYKLNLTLHPNTEINRDVVSAMLADISFESFEETVNGLAAYVPENLYEEKMVTETLENLPLPDISVQSHIEFIESRDWNEEWEKNFFQPIIIDNKVVIHSSFHKDIPQLTYDIVIDPKMAFGTGHHATTSLMVSYLLESDVENKSFLDMGCGTAVLAILAKMKGANPVTAIDNDEWAYNNALENIALNHTPAICVEWGDADLLGKETYDIIFANINRNILLNDIPVYVQCMHSGSTLFLSGFFSEDMEIIVELCKKYNLQLTSHKINNNWAALAFIRI
jgi:ribosomal protein L11 methyltransferase